MKNLILFFTAVLFSGNAIAQILYTDIIPDDTLVPDYLSDSKMIDFDGDLNPELIIFSSKQDTVISGFNVTISGIAISTLGNTEIIAKSATIGNEDVVIADTMGHGQLIGDTSSYLSSATPSVFPGVGLGIQTDFFGINASDFINNGKQFVGVKFEIGVNVHYGWIQVKIDSLAASGIVYDFAYQSVADSSIFAGAIQDDFVGVVESDLSNISVYTVNKNVVFKEVSKQITISMFNLLGEKVLSDVISTDKTINVGYLKSGIYLVSYSIQGKVITKKLVIE